MKKFEYNEKLNKWWSTNLKFNSKLSVVHINVQITVFHRNLRIIVWKDEKPSKLSGFMSDTFSEVVFLVMKELMDARSYYLTIFCYEKVLWRTLPSNFDPIWCIPHLMSVSHPKSLIRLVLVY